VNVLCLRYYFVYVTGTFVHYNMANNGTYSASNAANGTNNDTVTLDLTYAALAISIGAFILSSLQALLAYLQFDNSEVGRRRCSEEVMGELWAGKTIKKFKWREWRYQVFFEVPVFYTAPPG
jgi:TRAP-type C4-dicarboxylate transport system permease small subunit